MKKLERLNLIDNTFIIFLGDDDTDSPIVTMLNGKPYPDGKGETIDSRAHVPMTIHHPHTVNGINESLIDFTDFIPILCEAANKTIPNNKELGDLSFYPQLINKQKEVL